jgi:hypothetical protein
LAAQRLDGDTMSDQTVSIGLRTGWLTDPEMARERKKSPRAQRDERQKGIGPPWTRDGRDVLYSIEGYRQWLLSNERDPVRESQASKADRVSLKPRRVVSGPRKDIVRR